MNLKVLFILLAFSFVAKSQINEEQGKQLFREVYLNADKLLGKTIYELKVVGKPDFIYAVKSWEQKTHIYPDRGGELKSLLMINTRAMLSVDIGISARTGKSCVIRFAWITENSKDVWLEFLGTYFDEGNDFVNLKIGDDIYIQIRYYELADFVGVEILRIDPIEKRYYYFK